MLQNCSPQKQNRSPSKRNQKQSKQIKTVQQLIHFLASNRISITPQLSKSIMQINFDGQENKQIKLFSQVKSDEEIHKLKVKLADYEFQLKKIGEDFAEFQLLSKMDKDKCLRKIKQELQFERSKNIEDNTKWEKKFAQRQQQYEHECEAFRVKTHSQFQKAKDEALANADRKHAQVLNKKIKEHNEAIKHLQKTIETLKLQYHQNLVKERQNHQSQIQRLHKNHQRKVKQKQEIYESKIIAVQSEKKAEIKIIQQTKKQNTKIQEKYILYIGQIQRDKKKLLQKTDDFQMKYKVMSKRFEDKTKQLEEIKAKHEEQLLGLEQKTRQQIQNAKATFEHDKNRFLRQQYAKGQQLQMKVSKLNNIKEQMEHNYDKLLRILQTRFQRRQSKRQDIEAIQQYQQRLTAKQKQNHMIYHQLRMVQLEKENNDKIYTRIFTSQKKNKKSLSLKTDHYDFCTLLKQSKTTDCRQLIKASHK